MTESDTFTRKDLVHQLYKRHGGLAVPDIDRLVKIVFSCIGEGMEQDGKVLISGFGTFSKRAVKSRQILMPDGTKKASRERDRVWFQPAAQLKARLNSEGEDHD